MMMRLSVAEQDERTARATWSQIIEPGEGPAIALIEQLGPQEAWRWLLEAGAAVRGNKSHDVPKKLVRSVLRWYQAACKLDVASVMRYIDREDVTVVIPSDGQWPAMVNVLASQRPVCLWVKGDASWHERNGGSVAIVGSRAATAYGVATASDFAAEIAAQDVTVVSGGAFGVDIAAHRGALSVNGNTVVFLAGGIDAYYPRAHHEILERIAHSGGAVISEMGPGAQPLRSRFLRRNRLIAAVSDVTVVVEAGLRSGAMSTARHAAELMRPLGAIPGPITSATSQGCHALIRDGLAVCVSAPREVLELGSLPRRAAGGAQRGVQDEAMSTLFPQPVLSLADEGREDGNRAPTWLRNAMQQVIQALSKSRITSLDELVSLTGLAANTALSALGELELAGRTRWQAGGWKLVHNEKVGRM